MMLIFAKLQSIIKPQNPIKFVNFSIVIFLILFLIGIDSRIKLAESAASPQNTHPRNRIPSSSDPSLQFIGATTLSTPSPPLRQCDPVSPNPCLPDEENWNPTRPLDNLPLSFYTCTQFTTSFPEDQLNPLFQYRFPVCAPRREYNPIKQVLTKTLGIVHLSLTHGFNPPSLLIPQYAPDDISQVHPYTFQFKYPITNPIFSADTADLAIQVVNPVLDQPVTEVTLKLFYLSGTTRPPSVIRHRLKLTYYDPIVGSTITIATGLYYDDQLSDQCSIFAKRLRAMYQASLLYLAPIDPVLLAYITSSSVLTDRTRSSIDWLSCKNWPNGVDELECKPWFIGPMCGEVKEGILSDQPLFKPIFGANIFPLQTNPIFTSHAPIVFSSAVVHDSMCGFIPTVSKGTASEDWIAVDICKSMFNSSRSPLPSFEPTVVMLPHISQMHLYGFDNEDYPLLSYGEVAHKARRLASGAVLTQDVPTATLTAKLILPSGRVIYGSEFPVISECDAWNLPCSKRSTSHCEQVDESYQPDIFAKGLKPTIPLHFYQCVCLPSTYTAIFSYNQASQDLETSFGLTPHRSKWSSFTCDDLHRPYRRDIDFSSQSLSDDPTWYNLRGSRTFPLQVSNHLFTDDPILSQYHPTIPPTINPSDQPWGFTTITSLYQIAYHNPTHPNHSSSDPETLFLPEIHTNAQQITTPRWTKAVVALMYYVDNNDASQPFVPPLIHPSFARVALLPSYTDPYIIRSYRTPLGVGCAEGYYGHDCQFHITKPSPPFGQDVFSNNDIVSFVVTLDGSFNQPSLTCTFNGELPSGNPIVIFTEGDYYDQNTHIQGQPITINTPVTLSFYRMMATAGSYYSPESTPIPISLFCTTVQTQFGAEDMGDPTHPTFQTTHFSIPSFFSFQLGCEEFCHDQFSASCRLKFPEESEQSEQSVEMQCQCDPSAAEHLLDDYCSVFFLSDPRLVLPSPFNDAPSASSSPLPLETNHSLSYTYGDVISYVFSIAHRGGLPPYEGYFLRFNSILQPHEHFLIPLASPYPVTSRSSSNVQQTYITITEELFPQGVYSIELVRKDATVQVLEVITQWSKQNLYIVSIHKTKMKFSPSYSFPQGPMKPVLRVSWTPSILPEPHGLGLDTHFNSIFYRIGIVVENSCRHSLFGSYPIKSSQMASLPDNTQLSEWGIEYHSVNNTYNINHQSTFPAHIPYVDLDITNYVHILSVSRLCIEPVNLSTILKNIGQSQRFVPSRALGRFPITNTPLNHPKPAPMSPNSLQTMAPPRFDLYYEDFFSASLEVDIPTTIKKCLNGGIINLDPNLPALCTCPLRYYGLSCHLLRPWLLPSTISASQYHDYLDAGGFGLREEGKTLDNDYDASDLNSINANEWYTGTSPSASLTTTSSTQHCSLRCPVPLQPDSLCTQCICTNEYCRTTTRVFYLEAGPRVLLSPSTSIHFPFILNSSILSVIQSSHTTPLAKIMAYSSLLDQAISELNVILGLHTRPLTNNSQDRFTSLPLFTIPSVLTFPSLPTSYQTPFTPGLPLGVESIAIQPQNMKLTGEKQSISLMVLIKIAPFTTSSPLTHQFLFTQRFAEIQSSLSIFSQSYGSNDNTASTKRLLPSANYNTFGSLSLFGAAEYSQFYIKAPAIMLQTLLSTTYLLTLCTNQRGVKINGVLQQGKCPRDSLSEVTSSIYWPVCSSSSTTRIIGLDAKCYISGIPQEPLAQYGGMSGESVGTAKYEIRSTASLPNACSQSFPGYPGTTTAPCAVSPDLSRPILSPPYITDSPSELTLGQQYKVKWGYIGVEHSLVILSLIVRLPANLTSLQHTVPRILPFVMSDPVRYAIAIARASDFGVEIVIPPDLAEKVGGVLNKGADFTFTLALTLLEQQSIEFQSLQSYNVTMPQYCRTGVMGMLGCKEAASNSAICGLPNIESFTCGKYMPHSVCNESDGACVCVPPYYRLNNPRLLPPSSPEDHNSFVTATTINNHNNPPRSSQPSLSTLSSSTTSSDTPLSTLFPSYDLLNQCVEPCENGGDYSRLRKRCECPKQFYGLRCELHTSSPLCPLNIFHSTKKRFVSKVCNENGYQNSNLSVCDDKTPCTCWDHFYGEFCDQCSLTTPQINSQTSNTGHFNNTSIMPVSDLYCDSIGTEIEQTNQLCRECACKYGFYGKRCQYQGVLASINFTTTDVKPFFENKSVRIPDGYSYLDWLLYSFNRSAPLTRHHPRQTVTFQNDGICDFEYITPDNGNTESSIGPNKVHDIVQDFFFPQQGDAFKKFTYIEDSDDGDDLADLDDHNSIGDDNRPNNARSVVTELNLEKPPRELYQYVIPSPYYKLSYDYHLKTDIGLSLGVHPDSITIVQTYSRKLIAMGAHLNDTLPSDSIVNTVIIAIHLTDERMSSSNTLGSGHQDLLISNIKKIFGTLKKGSNKSYENSFSTLQSTSHIPIPAPIRSFNDYYINGIQSTPSFANMDTLKGLWERFAATYSTRLISSSPTISSFGSITGVSGLYDPHCIPSDAIPKVSIDSTNQVSKTHLLSTSAQGHVLLSTKRICDPGAIDPFFLLTPPPIPFVRPISQQDTTALVRLAISLTLGSILIIVGLVWLVWFAAVIAHWREFVIVGLLHGTNVDSNSTNLLMSPKQPGEISVKKSSFFLMTATTWPLCNFPVLSNQKRGSKAPGFWYPLPLYHYPQRQVRVDHNFCYHRDVSFGRFKTQYNYFITSGWRLWELDRACRLEEKFPNNVKILSQFGQLMKHLETNHDLPLSVQYQPHIMTAQTQLRNQPEDRRRIVLYPVYSPHLFTGSEYSIPSLRPQISLLRPILSHKYDYMNLTYEHFENEDDDCDVGDSDIDEDDHELVRQLRDNHVEMTHQGLKSRYSRETRTEVNTKLNNPHCGFDFQTWRITHEIALSVKPIVDRNNMTNPTIEMSTLGTTLVGNYLDKDSHGYDQGVNNPDQSLQFSNDKHDNITGKKYQHDPSFTSPTGNHERNVKDNNLDDLNDVEPSTTHSTNHSISNSSVSNKNCLAKLQLQHEGSAFKVVRAIFVEGIDFDEGNALIKNIQELENDIFTSNLSHDEDQDNIPGQEDKDHECEQNQDRLSNVPQNDNNDPPDHNNNFNPTDHKNDTHNSHSTINTINSDNISNNNDCKTIHITDTEGEQIINSITLNAFQDSPTSSDADASFDIEPFSAIQPENDSNDSDSNIDQDELFSDTRYTSYQNYIAYSMLSTSYPNHLVHGHNAENIENIFHVVWLKKYFENLTEIARQKNRKDAKNGSNCDDSTPCDEQVYSFKVMNYPFFTMMTNTVFREALFSLLIYGLVPLLPLPSRIEPPTLCTLPSTIEPPTLCTLPSEIEPPTLTPLGALPSEIEPPTLNTMSTAALDPAPTSTPTTNPNTSTTSQKDLLDAVLQYGPMKTLGGHILQALFGCLCAALKSNRSFDRDNVNHIAARYYSGNVVCANEFLILREKLTQSKLLHEENAINPLNPFLVPQSSMLNGPNAPPSSHGLYIDTTVSRAADKWEETFDPRQFMWQPKPSSTPRLSRQQQQPDYLSSSRQKPLRRGSEQLYDQNQIITTIIASLEDNNWNDNS